jgi:hypothetical protein
LVNNLSDADPGNDPGADPDGDGLTNAQESDYGTSASVSDANGDGIPDGRDTDGDGVGDRAEVEQGSDPLDPASSEPADVVPVSFSFGDNPECDSNSEKYRLTVTPVSPGDTRGPMSRLNRDYGDPQTETLRLVRGVRYEVTLDHSATDPLYEGSHGSFEPCPDYDYVLEISSSACIITNDPGGILGSHHESSPFFAAGKKVTLSVLKVGLVPDYDRNGEIDGADRSRAANSEVFRLWINDDSDVGDIAEGDSDVPGQSNGNFSDGVGQGTGVVCLDSRIRASTPFRRSGNLTSCRDS